VDYEPERRILLKRGVIFAYAHVRGGGEFGTKWHDEGRLLNKKNSFQDFLDCAEHLIRSGYTRPEKLCCKGISAGGLLVATSMNLKPEYFQSVILRVPFLDVSNTMLNENLPLTMNEYEEWGNPKSKEVLDFIKSYSPYQNIDKEKNYPHLLITSSLFDYRVPFWNSLKFVAKMREFRRMKDNKKLLLLRMKDYGHNEEIGKNAMIENVILEYSFICSTLEVDLKLNYELKNKIEV
jgi:oligopeptidase B